MSLVEQRKRIADAYGFRPCPIVLEDKVGISQNVRSGLQPINGVRHLPENGTSGWYIWAGEKMSEADDYFVPLHATHLEDWCPEVLPYLELPPGWHFLIAPGYEDVWFNEDLDLSPLPER